MTAAIDRRAARILLRDGDGAILLIHGHDPLEPDGPSWWTTPGGGIEPGETDEAAAARELAEETGLVGVPLGPVVWLRDAEFGWNGMLLRQHEVYYEVRVPRFEPDPSGWTELEQGAQDEMRWWTPDELRATTETIYPEALVELLVTLDARDSA